jgi:D-alanine-D-alanine ligase
MQGKWRMEIVTKTIGVLAGGDSPERNVSLLSGTGVFDALQRLGHNAQMVKIDTLDDLVPKLGGIDIAFNCLHGGSGEDGTVQLLLDVMGIPTIGSGPLACARAMDKARAKAILRSKDLPTPAGVSLDRTSLEPSIEEAVNSIAFPMILKPQSGGSTIAVHLARSEEDLLTAAHSMLAEFDTILLEPFIAGRELTVGILLIDGEEQALPIIEIRFPGQLFDYGAKYTDGQAEFLSPAPISLDVTNHIQDIALRAHQALECFGFSRVDFRLSDDGVPYILEVNTLPGMTPLSDLPRAAAVRGIKYDDLVEIMLFTASQRKV